MKARDDCQGQEMLDLAYRIQQLECELERQQQENALLRRQCEHLRIELAEREQRKEHDQIRKGNHPLPGFGSS